MTGATNEHGESSTSPVRMRVFRLLAALVMVGIPLALVEGTVELLLRNPQVLQLMPETIREAVTRLYIHRDRMQIGMSRA